MALSFAHGAIQWLAADAVNTTYPVTGLTFQPKALRFYWVGLQSASDAVSEAVNERRGMGFAVDTSNRRCVGSFSQDTAATSNCGTVARNDAVVVTTDGAGASDGRLDLSALASDGFTLIVDDQGVANLTVFWEAWGGSDITVAAVGDFAEPAAAGDQDYTVTGFTADATNQVVLLAGVQSIAAINTAEADASGMYVGFAASTTAADNVVIAGSADDASNAMDTDGYSKSDECLAMCAKAGAAVANARAVLTAWLADAFRLNWLEVGVTSRKSIFLAIKGGSWKSGSYTIASNSLNATATVSGLPFTPIGLCLMSTSDPENTTDVFGTHDQLNLGTGSSTSSRRAMGVWDEDATASSVCEINTILEYDQVLASPSNAGGIDILHDIDAMLSDGFRIIVDDAGGSATEMHGYLTFGDAPAAAPYAAQLAQQAGAGYVGAVVV